MAVNDSSFLLVTVIRIFCIYSQGSRPLLTKSISVRLDEPPRPLSLLEKSAPGPALKYCMASSSARIAFAYSAAA